MIKFNAYHNEPKPITMTKRRVYVFVCSVCGDFDVDEEQEIDVFGDRADSIMHDHFNEVHKVN